MSPRTLQRRLRDKRVLFNDVLDAMRFRAAKSYLAQPFGNLSPYAGVAASSLAAVERSAVVDLDPVSTGSSLSYAGLSYRWRPLVLSAEVQRASEVTFAFRVGTRF